MALTPAAPVALRWLTVVDVAVAVVLISLEAISRSTQREYHPITRDLSKVDKFQIR